MTFLNFSDYLKFQLNRDIQREEFSKFILNQKLIKVGKRSDMNANILFYYENTTDTKFDADNVISGDKVEFYSCDRNTIYYAIDVEGSAGNKTYFLQAELDKVMVANNFVFLIKSIKLIEAADLVKATPKAHVENRVAAYA